MLQVPVLSLRTQHTPQISAVLGLQLEYSVYISDKMSPFARLVVVMRDVILLDTSGTHTA